MHFFKLLKDVEINVENKGTELVITAKGTKENIAALEKKLGAIKELCHNCCDDCENCC